MSATRWPGFTPNASITSPGLCHSSRLRARSDSCGDVRTAEAIENDAALTPIKKTTTKGILCDFIFEASLCGDLNRYVPAFKVRMASTFRPLICGEWRIIVANKMLRRRRQSNNVDSVLYDFRRARSTFKLMSYQPNSSARIVLRFRT